MSDHTRRTIDEEQQYLTDLAHRRALKLVAENRRLLEAFASTLLENEVLERDDIERIVGAYKRGDALEAGGDPPLPVPVAQLEPGAAQVAAAERLEDGPGADPPA